MLNYFDTILAFVAVMAGVSLIVTTLTQAAGTLFAFRGRHLRWGLTSLIENFAPELRDRAEALSGHLLRHPLVSDSVFSERAWVARSGLLGVVHFIWRGWKYASAVRPEELRAIVANLAEGLAATETIVAEALQSVSAGKTLEEALPKLTEQARELSKLDGLANYWTRVLGPYLKACAEMEEAAHNDVVAKRSLAEEIVSMFRAMDAVGRLESKIRAGVSDGAAAAGVAWDRWFDSAMDRVSQRFATHMQAWTCVFSFVIAFGCGLDSLALFKRLAADPELRARVTASTEALRDQMKSMEPGASSGGTNVVTSRKASTTNLEAKTDAKGDAKSEFTEKLGQVREQTRRLEALLGQHAELEIFALNGPIPGSLRELIGRMASALLLSLGAPFWFNTLRKMSNLRPLLANKQENEK